MHRIPPRALKRAALVGGALSGLAGASAAVAHLAEVTTTVAPVAMAMQAPPPEPTPAPPVREEPAAPAVDLVPAREASSDLHVAEIHPAYTDLMSALERVRAAVLNTRELRDTVTELKDIIRLSCVRDKLLQLEGLLAQLERERTILSQRTASDADRERAGLVARKNSERAVVLENEAGACSGAEVLGTEVTITVDDDSTIKDPTQVPEPMLVPDRPPPASPAE